MAEKGLPILLDNIEIRGIDQLKMMVEDWQKEVEQRKAMMQKQQEQEMQNNPLVMKNHIEIAKLQQKKEEIDAKKQEHEGQFKIDLEELKVAQFKVMADLQIAKENSMTQRIKAEAERFAKQVDLAMKKKDMHHRHFKEAIELHHTVHQPKENRANQGA